MSQTWQKNKAKKCVRIVVIKYNVFRMMCVLEKKKTDGTVILLYSRVTSSVTSMSFVPPGRVFSSADFHEDKSEKKEI